MVVGSHKLFRRTQCILFFVPTPSGAVTGGHHISETQAG